MADDEHQNPGTSKKRRITNPIGGENLCESNCDGDEIDPQISSAFRQRIQTCKVDLSNFPTNDIKEIFNKIHQSLYKLVKVNVVINRIVRARFELIGILDGNEYDTFNVNTQTLIDSKEVVKQVLVEIMETILLKLAEIDPSNKVTKQLLYLNVDFENHEPNKARETVPLPKHITSEHVVVVSAEDSSKRSFLWAVLSALHPDVEPTDKELHEFTDELSMDGIQYPVQLEDIPKIEEMNDGISFNVFMLKFSMDSKREEINGPVYHTKSRKPKHINLLLLHDEGTSQYTYICNLRGLVNPNNNGHICDGCLIFFETTEKVKEHQKEECLRVTTVLPTENILKFSNHQNRDMVPIVVYADFESFIKPIQEKNTKKRVAKETFTKNVSEHIPYGFSYYMKCAFDNTLSTLEVYIGENCIKNFISKLTEDVFRIIRRANKYNISIVPVFFHNFGGYDSHFFLKHIENISMLGDTNRPIALFKDIIDKNSGLKVSLRFLDSYAFLKESLEKLTENLSSEPKKFKATREEFKDIDDEQFRLLNRKGVLPYEYIQSYDCLSETSLPGKEHFYDRLKGCHITDKDYEYALSIWNSFQCTNLRDYVKLYMKTDVLFLADVFDNFRRFSLKMYKLDPAHYYSVAALSLDAMFKYTDAEVELLTDVSMLMLFKNAMRGGIAHCCKRHVAANNKYLTETYDVTKPESYLMYYDANNLYGSAMSQPLPYGGFEWVDVNVDFNVPADSKVGYVLEVDLDYPKELHDDHADLPFCPEKKDIPGGGETKFIANLYPKQKYVIHYLNLKQCIDHGLKVKKIHRILKFNQKPWLKTYVDYNTEMRSEAKNKTDKDLFKLMNNSIYGKLSENIEKYSNVKMFGHWSQLGNWRGAYHIVGRPDYHSRVICSENLLAVKLKNTALKFNKPIYVGFCVLEIAKLHIYKFHYDVMKPKFGDNLKLLYTDTDSLLYQIFTTDYYEKMRDILGEYFDTSDYEVDNPFGYPLLNKKSIGFFKDEFNGDIIREFVALRQKVYYINGLKKNKNTAGVPRIITDNLSIDDYKTCLYNQEKIYKEMHRILADGPNVYTQHIRKVALSPKYNGRCVLENLIDTLPWGHYNVEEKTAMDIDSKSEKM